jgi:hypothetical protein
MKPLWGTAVLALVVGSATADAADLSRIERVVGREPAYGAQPHYCLLVFGPEAETRIWLVMAGETLYVSNNIGELTGDGSRAINPSTPGGRWYEAGHVSEVDGRTTHANLRVQRLDDSYRVLVNNTNRKRFQGAGFDSDNKLLFAERPEEAPIIHFAGSRVRCRSACPDQNRRCGVVKTRNCSLASAPPASAPAVSPPTRDVRPRTAQSRPSWSSQQQRQRVRN